MAQLECPLPQTPMFRETSVWGVLLWRTLDVIVTLAQLSSIAVTLQTVQEAVKKIETNLVSVEQQQVKINESVKELTKLLKNQERENFPSKAPLGR